MERWPRIQTVLLKTREKMKMQSVSKRRLLRQMNPDPSTIFLPYSQVMRVAPLQVQWQGSKGARETGRFFLS